MTSPHPEPARRRTAAVSAATLLALVAVTLLVSRTTQAAFTASTENTGSSVVAGDVTITDDDLTAALFTEAAFAPGDSVVECLAVTYAGSIADPGPVRVHVGGVTEVAGPDPASDGLGDELLLTIEEGVGGGLGSCGGFTPATTLTTATPLRTLAATATDHATGLGAWDPSGTPETVTYRFTATLDPATPDAEQGAGVSGISFVWEVTT